MTVDRDWYPLDAFVRLSVREELVGSSWFRFTEDTALCEGYTVEDGPVSQRIATPGRTGYFGTHALHGDAWACATFVRDSRLAEPTNAPNFSTSHMPNGGSGPILIPTDADFLRKVHVGQETIQVTAGNFDTEKFQFFVGDYPPIDIWTMGSDFVPIRLRWDLLDQTYELVELEGDPAGI